MIPWECGVVMRGARPERVEWQRGSAGAGSLDFTQVLTFRNPHSALRTPHSAAALPPTNGREPLRNVCSAATRGTSDVAVTVRILHASARQSGVGKRREHGRFWLSRPPLRSQAARNAECGVRNAKCEMQNPEIRSGGGGTWVKSRLPGPSHDLAVQRAGAIGPGEIGPALDEPSFDECLHPATGAGACFKRSMPCREVGASTSGAASFFCSPQARSKAL